MKWKKLALAAALPVATIAALMVGYGGDEHAVIPGTYRGGYYGAAGCLSIPGAVAGGSYRFIAPSSGVNLLTDSWHWESLAWSGISVNSTVTPGQPDPFGGTTASKMQVVGAGSAWLQEIYSPPFTIPTDNNVVFSVYLKTDAAVLPHDPGVRLYNRTKTTLCVQGATWTTPGAGVLWAYGSATGPGATGGMDVIGGGWYRLWVSVDIAANIAGSGWARSDLFDVRLAVWGGSVDPAIYLYAVGAQFEPGTAPSAYIEKP